MTEYSEYYDNTTPFDEDIEAFKDHLRKAVKEETQKELETLRTSVREMGAKLANLTALERDAEFLKRQYEQKLHNVEVVARRTVEKEGLRKLLELLREPRYRVERKWDLGPKCGNCNEDRKLPYTTPRGKEAFEDCECNVRPEHWTVEEQLVHEVSRRSGKVLAWYSPVSRYFDEDNVGSPTVLKSPDGVTLEEMMKDPRDYGFPTAEAAEVLATVLNKAGRE